MDGDGESRPTIVGGTNMALVVMKFGGSSVADKDCIERVSQIIADARNKGNDVIAVLSAQGGTTDELAEKAREISEPFAGPGMDMLLTAGEQISVALMAIQLEKMGVAACPRLGWQLGIKTDSNYGNAEILSVDTGHIRSLLNDGKVVLAAGFQGVDDAGEITALGRGGSDTTAVALAAAMGAEKCLIYTDVDGVYTADPRIDTSAKKLDRISFDDMLSMALHGAKVLHEKSIRIAKEHDVELWVLSSFDPTPGTLVCRAG